MARLAAYLGPPITLGHLLLDPGQRLVKDSHSFGVGWYAPDASPAVYAQPLPIWSDANLPHLARALSSSLWLAHAQSLATNRAGQADTQPFHDEDFIFAHSGLIQDFRDTLCPTMRQFLAPPIEAEIQSHHEAEFLFAIVRHLLTEDEDLSLDQALAEMFTLLQEWLEQRPALLNIIISDGEGLYAARHAINAECAPLYFSTDDEGYPNGQLIASERLTPSEFWQPVPEHHILILDPYEPPELLAL